MTTNLPASVRARLLNFARSENLPFQEVLVRYGMERTLYRLQQSEAADQFILKGAMLFLDWTKDFIGVDPLSWTLFNWKTTKEQ